MKYRYILLYLVLLFCSNILSSQDRYSFEVRGASAMPISKLGDANLDFGWGGEGVFNIRLLQSVRPYIGWSWNRFSGVESTNSIPVVFTETGFLLGVGIKIPIAKSKSGYYFRIGGDYSNLNEKSKSVDFTDISGRGFGWHMAVNLDIELVDNWRLMPGVKFKSTSRNAIIKSVDSKIKLNYFSAGIGIAKAF